MSLTTHEYDQLKKPNIHRRYILESPIYSTTIRNSNKHKQQIETKNSSKTKEYSRSNLTKSSFYGINEDPWVKELLERDIDFSKLDQQEEQIQLLDISNINNSKSNSQQKFNNQQNLQPKIKRSSQSPFIINDKSKRINQYQPIYSSQSKFNNLFSFFFKLVIFTK